MDLRKALAVDLRKLVHVNGATEIQITMGAWDALAFADDLDWCALSTDRNYGARKVRGAMKGETT
ncbi:hypothetical protein [Mameliella alba]|uniref:hypothetical protein n=1 Tax=Mameliella alba TaxID=561184 RepID=UPI001056CFB1|nr:hypothetical protein [Mameliella alba]